MDMIALLYSAGILGAICLGFGVLIVLTNRKFYVWEDPRIQDVEELLPGTNCGACANPGCHAFAENLVAGNTEPVACTVMGSEDIGEIADYLGVNAGEAHQRVARVLCGGGRDENLQLAQYQGFDSCKAAAMVAGGGKGCTWGCLGIGDCVTACDIKAIVLNGNGLPIVDIDTCNACGDCVTACPKDLIELMPLDQQLLVQCKNKQQGEIAEALCSAVCNSCGRCAHDAPAGLITIKDGLAQINYQLPVPLTPDAIKRCPTRAIVWLEDKQFTSSSPDDRQAIH